ncbi:hypothetical protein FEM03_20745 [Phragmitibacter flavus]|uniref:Uncharacterized protein n=1 Tax=Phragmitibacter flavus TaxID=2576071 RepID=A0A5R8KA32_9BACT|nr:hypothetical protein [Phragmitibacter flavus]TLD68765.1 hypothetical protein FEM03_20745 [Phragmitibacter flavus]
MMASRSSSKRWAVSMALLLGLAASGTAQSMEDLRRDYEEYRSELNELALLRPDAETPLSAKVELPPVFIPDKPDETNSAVVLLDHLGAKGKIQPVYGRLNLKFPGPMLACLELAGLSEDEWLGLSEDDVLGLKRVMRLRYLAVVEVTHYKSGVALAAGKVDPGLVDIRAWLIDRNLNQIICVTKAKASNQQLGKRMNAISRQHDLAGDLVTNARKSVYEVLQGATGGVFRDSESE